MAFISLNPGTCRGCGSCVLACSISHFGTFSPKKSFIKIKRFEREGRYEIVIDSRCVPCPECAKYCYYGTITFVEDE